MLARTQNYPFFLEKLKNLFIDRLIELYTLYLKSEIELSLAQINEEINKMFLAGIPLYQ